MYSFLLHFHSGLRWIALALLLILIINSVVALIQKRTYTGLTQKLSFSTMLSMHVQLLLGLWLYAISPKVLFDTGIMKSILLRFFTMEHPLMMLIAIALITIGHVKGKRQQSRKSHKSLLVFGLLGIIVLLAGIPWPFREGLGATWF
jgi:hypothetical protein